MNGAGAQTMGGAEGGALPVLSLSTLFPNDRQPMRGISIAHRLRRLLANGVVQPHVVAPVPWSAPTHRRFGPKAGRAAVSREEERFGLPVTHPPYPTIPKLNTYLAPLLMACALYGHIARIAGATGARLLDAHRLYPDGVAAAWMARRLRLPLVLNACGSDTDLLRKHPLPRRMVLAATRVASAVICGSQALRQRLAEFGVEQSKLHWLRSGVDLKAFAPMHRDEARLATGMRGRSLLCVGALCRSEGHHLVIEALRQQPGDVNLTIVGDGADGARLRQLAEDYGVRSRVTFVGVQPQSQLRAFYSAADALVLAPRDEDLPEVVLEAMACGAPVVATALGGIPEVVTSADAGLLTEQRTGTAIAQAISRLLTHPPDRQATRRHAAQFSWDSGTRGRAELITRIVAAERERAIPEAAIPHA